jgi:uncharacterized protein YcaQ
MRRLSLDTAQRIALAAQGFAEPRPTGRVDVRHFRRLMDRIGVLQLDSVNVVSRSHYLPVFARLGPYEHAALDRYTARSGELFEYWGHVASLIPSDQHRLFRWRMDEFKPWRSIAKLEREHPGYVDQVYRAVAERGPLRTADLEERGDRTGPWWGYAPGKLVLEWLFAQGRITAYRDKNFHRFYDLPERVLSPEHLAAEPADKESAYRELLMLAARHHGVGTAKDLADYHRLNVPVARKAFAALVAAGELEQVEVEGWTQPAYLHPEARRPRSLVGSALLSPFDSLVWERDRTERLFGFHYRIEIYVPEPQRIHGYYVLPYLLDGQLVGRVDLKAHRKEGYLEARSAFIEPGQDAQRVASSLAADLEAMAAWIGLGEVRVARKGDLASALRKAIG